MQSFQHFSHATARWSLLRPLGFGSMLDILIGTLQDVILLLKCWTFLAIARFFAGVLSQHKKWAVLDPLNEAKSNYMEMFVDNIFSS